MDAEEAAPSDPFAVYDEAEEGNYDFIEPAVDPRYSLPDEEMESELFAEPEDEFDSEEVLEEEASIEFEEDANLVFEDDTEFVFDENTDGVYDDAVESGEEIVFFEGASDEDAIYEYTEEDAPEFEQITLDEQTGEVTFLSESSEIAEEVEPEAEDASTQGYAEPYDEDNLPDIDDSYLADEPAEEELPDIDDSKLE